MKARNKTHVPVLYFLLCSNTVHVCVNLDLNEIPILTTTEIWFWGCKTCSLAIPSEEHEMLKHQWQTTTPHHNHFTALFRDHPGEPVPEENFWTLWCKGRLTEADTPTIRMDATLSGLTSAHLHHPPYFNRPDALPATQPTVSKHWKQLVHSD